MTGMIPRTTAPYCRGSVGFVGLYRAATGKERWRIVRDTRQFQCHDALNPAALKRLIAGGVNLRPFSNDIMVACYKATQEVYDEIASKNAKFKKVYEPWKKFREDQVQWFQVAENRFDNFMITAERQSQRGGAKKK